MVDETLKRLLEAESKAELIITRADEAHQAIIEQARHDVRVTEQQHADRVKEIHASFLAQAEQRAQQTITELKLRHAEHTQALRAVAQQHAEQALNDAVNLLAGRGSP